MKTIQNNSTLPSSVIPNPLPWILSALLVGSLWFVQSSQHIDDKASPKEVIMKARQAAMLLSKHGIEALSTLRDHSSPFSWKDTYVFVVNCSADLVMSNPGFPGRVGGDILQHKDYRGKPYGIELCEAASNTKGAWIEYSWPKAGETIPLRKISYVISVPGQPYQVGAGIYDSNYTLQELNEMIRNSP